MPTRIPRRTLLAAAGAVPFLPLAAAEPYRIVEAQNYPDTQVQGDVTVAVQAMTEEDHDGLFGKAKPYKHGFLPVLLVLTNGGAAPLDLKNLQARYTLPGREGVEAWPADEIAYWSPKLSKTKKFPIPRPRLGVKGKKGPLADNSMVERSFQAPFAAPGETAGGFFYFLVGDTFGPRSGATLYVSGIRDLRTGQDLFYFEIPIKRP